jgi:hypothetical protein
MARRQWPAFQVGEEPVMGMRGRSTGEMRLV